MKLVYKLAAIFMAAPLFTVAMPDETKAQTQCPVGTAAGSATCGPDNGGYAQPAAPPVYRERLDGFGGFAYNLDTGEVYKSSEPGTSFERSAERALISCRQPLHDPEWSMTVSPYPDARCESLIAWHNGCAAVASGKVGEMTRYFSVKARNARSARTEAVRHCEANAASCVIVHDAVCVQPVIRTYRR